MGWQGPQTRRQFEAWEEWERAEWNKPDRHDWYAMQTASCVEQLTEVVDHMFSKSRPDIIQVGDKKLEFKTVIVGDGDLSVEHSTGRSETRRAETKEQKAKREMEENKRIWLGMLPGVTMLEKKK